MEFTVKVMMEDKLEALMNRLIAALESHQGGGCCKEPDPAEELKAKMEAEKEAPPPKKEKKKAAPKEEKKTEPEKAVTMDDVRKALSTYSAGDGDKRAQAVEMLKEFHPSGKLLRIPPKDFGAIITRLAAL